MSNWIDKHSVNCYFCGTLFDEREGVNADRFNDDAGGTACQECAAVQEHILMAKEDKKK